MSPVTKFQYCPLVTALTSLMKNLLVGDISKDI